MAELDTKKIVALGKSREGPAKIRKVIEDDAGNLSDQELFAFRLANLVVENSGEDLPVVVKRDAARTMIGALDRLDAKNGIPKPQRLENYQTRLVGMEGRVPQSDRYISLDRDLVEGVEPEMLLNASALTGLSLTRQTSLVRTSGIFGPKGKSEVQHVFVAKTDVSTLFTVNDGDICQYKAQSVGMCETPFAREMVWENPDKNIHTSTLHLAAVAEASLKFRKFMRVAILQMNDDGQKVRPLIDCDVDDLVERMHRNNNGETKPTVKNILGVEGDENIGYYCYGPSLQFGDVARAPDRAVDFLDNLRCHVEAFEKDYTTQQINIERAVPFGFIADTNIEQYGALVSGGRLSSAGKSVLYGGMVRAGMNIMSAQAAESNFAEISEKVKQEIIDVEKGRQIRVRNRNIKIALIAATSPIWIPTGAVTLAIAGGIGLAMVGAKALDTITEPITTAAQEKAEATYTTNYYPGSYSNNQYNVGVDTANQVNINNNKGTVHVNIRNG